MLKPLKPQILLITSTSAAVEYKDDEKKKKIGRTNREAKILGGRLFIEWYQRDSH